MEIPFEPLTNEQVDMLLLGTDEVVHEMSRPSMVNALVLLAREVKHRRAGRLPLLQWAAPTGNLAAALGVVDRAEDIVNCVIDEGGGVRAALDEVQRTLPDCSFEEWTVIAYALGHFDAAMNGAKP